MIDLTPSFSEAAKRAGTWSDQDCDVLISLIRKAIPDCSMDWDDDAGETWISFLTPEKLVAVVRCDAPLIIVLGVSASEIRRAVEAQDVIIIPVADMDDPQFMLDPSSAQSRLFRRWLWRSPTINPGKFSIKDLWWVTI